jgi:hypothetical protein
MPKDHFVPQFYLRHFGADTKRTIVVTVSPYRFIGIAPIDGQCQERNFYENNSPLNQLLWRGENDMAPVLSNVIKNRDFILAEANVLKYLASTLHTRTRKAAEVAKVFPKFMAREVIQNAIDRGELPPPPEGQLTEDMIDFGQVSGLLVQQSFRCWLEMHTLDCKLLQTNSPANFITSDNPVVILNQFCVGFDPHRSHAGFSKSGFQLSLPISPNLCVFLYDASVYKVGNRRDRVVSISKQDVEIINSFQIQSAEMCLYFHDPILETQVKRLIDLYAPLRVSIRDSLRVIPLRAEKEELLHIRTPSAKLPGAWSFCRYRKHIKSKPGERRDPAWTEIVDRLMEDIEHNPDAGDLSARLEKIVGSL